MDAYHLAAAFADAESGELFCLEHPIPFAAGEDLWFEDPSPRDDALITTAHVLASGATGTREITVAVPVADGGEAAEPAAE